MLPGTWPPKGPNEIFPYTWNFGPRMEDGDTIVSTTATVRSQGGGEVTKNAHAVATGSPQKTVTWLGAGTSGKTYYIDLHATTTLGCLIDEVAEIRIVSR